MKRISAAISLILAVLMLFSALPSYAFSQEECDGRVYFYNLCGGGVLTGDCIFIQSGESWGMIDTGHRFESTLTDDSGKVYNVSRANYGLSNQEEYKNGRDAVQYMMDSFGLKHLDFIIATHSHSDHIGGVPEIAQLQYTDGEGNSHYIVDENTVYIYKQYYHVNNQNDDLVQQTYYSWHNQAFYEQAVKAMRERGALMVEVSKGCFTGTPCKNAALFAADVEGMNAMPSLYGAYYSGGAAKDYYDDTLTFKMGALQISLYNLFAHQTSFDENVNSIAAVITNGKQKLVTMGDLNIEEQAEQKTAAAIAKAFGTVDLFKANHHGSNSYSNSQALLDSLQPRHIVITRNDPVSAQLSNRGGLSLAILYAREVYATDFYEVGASGFALVAELTQEELLLHSVSGVGEDTAFGDVSPCVNMVLPSEGWNGWIADINNSADFYYIQNGELYKGWLEYNEKLYYFAQNGQMLRGWLYENDLWYYFGWDGAMKIGWVKDGGKWYYMAENGGFKTGWVKADDGREYYFGEDGVMKTGVQLVDGSLFCFGTTGEVCKGWYREDGCWYYFGDYGVGVTGWNKIGGKWYFFNNYGVMQTGWIKSNGAWYFLGESGAMDYGWQKIGGAWYYFNNGGAMQTNWQRLGGSWYYFGESGAMKTGVQSINGRNYTFSPSGAWVL